MNLKPLDYAVTVTIAAVTGAFCGTQNPDWTLVNLVSYGVVLFAASLAFCHVLNHLRWSNDADS